ncbi:MAG: DegV family protein [Pseudomonadota bacterium]
MTTADTTAAAAPAVETVDGAWFRGALVTGINRVIARRDHINRINVFPVADSDTGTNLALTLHSVLTGATRSVQRHLGQFMEQVADHALDGARGNSGAIMAQYWQGFAEAVVGHAQLDSRQFAEAVAGAARSAQEAIAKPQPGTMLTVVQDHAAAVHAGLAEGLSDLREVLRAALLKARASLANTPNQLDVLKAAGVVDAGAQGFVDLLEGMQEFADTGEITSVLPTALRLDDSETPSAVAVEQGDVVHRFCTECLVSSDGLDRRRLRESLSELDASSLVVAGTRTKMRVHIHTNDPPEVFRTCERFGEVSAQKADDMQTQVESVSQERRLAIAVDSGADIPDELHDLYPLHVVPLRVTVDNYQYIDKVSLSVEDFYLKIQEAGSHPTTSQPPPSDYRRQFEFLCSHFQETLCISVSGALSGTLQAAEAAARRLEDGRVRVWDSRHVSTSQGLLAIYAAEAAAAGMSAEQVVQLLEHMKERTRSVAVVRDLKFAVRGGRISPAVKSVTDVLRITPIIATTKQGTVAPAGALFSRRAAVQRFAAWVSRRLRSKQARYRLVVAHCDAAPEADILTRHLKQQPEVDQVWQVAAGAALGAHAGPGCLIVGMQDYVPPQELARLLKDE